MTEADAIVERIGTVTSREELWNLLLDYFHSKHIDKVSYHAGATELHEARIRANGFPDDWVCHYIGDGLVQIDPIPQLAATMARPFLWSETASLAQMTPENLSYLDELAQSGLGDGLAFTVFGPLLRNAYVGLGFRPGRAKPSAAEIMSFQLVAQMGHVKFCQLTDAEEVRRPQLSKRERQTLHWAACGKSNAAIAQILDVSPHTIDTLMRRIYAKLDVADRTSAAIKAIGSGLLQYQELR